MKKTGVLGFAALLLILAGGRQASAELTLTFSDTPASLVLAGTPPSTPGPYATVTFDTHLDNSSIAVGTVQMTWSVVSSVSGLFIGAAGLNFVKPSNLTITGVNTLATSVSAGGAGKVQGTGNGSGNEKFNTTFSFPTANSGTRLSLGNPAIYDITGFSIPSNGDLTGLLTGNSDGFLGAIHLQGYSSSTGLAPSESQNLPSVVPVPEPSTLIAASTGLLMGLGFWWRRRRFVATV